MDNQRYRIIEHLKPEILLDLVRLHMDYYCAEWGLGDRFEASLIEGFESFAARFDPKHDYFAYVRNRHGNVVGTIALDDVDRQDSGGRLRWFIVDPGYSGAGIGRALLERALAFADARGISPIWLTTFEGLDAARHLYEAHGFVLHEETAGDVWGGTRGEQRFVRTSPELRA